MVHRSKSFPKYIVCGLFKIPQFKINTTSIYTRTCYRKMTTWTAYYEQGKQRVIDWFKYHVKQNADMLYMLMTCCRLYTFRSSFPWKRTVMIKTISNINNHDLCFWCIRISVLRVFCHHYIFTMNHWQGINYWQKLPL